MGPTLRFPERISARMAGKKVCDFLLHGPHAISPRPRTKSEAQQVVDTIAAATGTLLVQEARNYRAPLPHIENMAAGSTWQLSKGASISDAVSGQVIFRGPGEVSTCSYLTLFERACEARERAVQRASYSELLAALALGQASIEGFLNHLSLDRPRARPNETLPTARVSGVSLEHKIHVWYPTMTGARLSKNSRVWQKFVAAKRLRNTLAIHPSASVTGVSYRSLARRIDDFREAIVLLLAQLHVYAGRCVSEAIINAYYFPEVRIAQATDN